MRSRIVATLVVCLLIAVAAAAQTQHVAGTVTDSSGKRVAGATVKLSSGSWEQTTATDANGSFMFSNVPTGTGTITIHTSSTKGLQAPWNGETTLDVRVEGPAGACCSTCICIVPVQVVLVTATKTNVALDDTPADAIVTGSDTLAVTPALTLDDVLRQVPGFTLFRRSSSRTANPGTQGVSMRGVGASGASRALVIVDEVPLNDPFGGWVYWDRVVRESISEVEVVRGGADASLYGSTAMGGVIQFRTREPEQPSVSVESSWGSENTPQASLWAGTRHGPWEGAIAADLFQTNGYIPVPESYRGPVDAPADSHHQLVSLDLGRRFNNSGRYFARGSFFNEGRHNGTILQKNTTQIGDFSTGLNYDTHSAGAISARLFGLFESYHQTFSSVRSVVTQRDTESLTDDQYVPSQALGGSAQWSKALGKVHTAVAGFEMREVHGASNDALFKKAAPNGHTLSGGHERTSRIFGEDILQLTPKFLATVSLGYDHWSDSDARLIAISPAGAVTTTQYPGRTSDAVNPRVSLLYHLSHGTSLTASGYRAFRAPTLNELYRNFTQGNIVTYGNPALHAERLTGVEAGIRQGLLSNRLNLRATFFWNDITGAIANVTQTPTTRLKENIARTLSTGINLDGEFRINSQFQIQGGYQFAHAVVSGYAANPSNPSLVGNWIPEVPHQQFTLQARYHDPKFFTATVQGTFVGQQFDDDLNTLLLDKFFTVDLYLSRSLRRGVEVFGAAENLFNQRYYTNLNPVPSRGAPLLARIGLRYQFPNR